MQAHSDVPRRENGFEFSCGVRAANSAEGFADSETVDQGETPKRRCLESETAPLFAVCHCARYRKVTICPRVQRLSGENVAAVVPLVIRFSVAQRTGTQ